MLDATRDLLLGVGLRLQDFKHIVSDLHELGGVASVDGQDEGAHSTIVSDAWKTGWREITGVLCWFRFWRAKRSRAFGAKLFILQQQRAIRILRRTQFTDHVGILCGLSGVA